MSNAIFDIEFMPGTELSEALQEAKDKANKFDVAYIRFTFNGIDFSISKKANIKDLLEQYNKILSGSLID